MPRHLPFHRMVRFFYCERELTYIFQDVLFIACCAQKALAMHLIGSSECENLLNVFEVIVKRKKPEYIKLCKTCNRERDTSSAIGQEMQIIVKAFKILKSLTTSEAQMHSLFLFRRGQCYHNKIDIKESEGISKKGENNGAVTAVRS